MLFKMLQLPLSLFSNLILPHLPLMYFNLTLLATSQIMISLPDPLSHQIPQRTRLVGTLRSIRLASYNRDDVFTVVKNIVKLGLSTRPFCEFGILMP